MALATASAVLRTAASKVGYLEGYDASGHKVSSARNWTMFWAALKPSFQGAPWCAAFVQWCLKQNGMWFDCPLPFYVPSFVQTAKAKGIWREVGTYTPKPGDLVVMGDPGRYQHIGFIEKPLIRGKNQHLEGNTSSGVVGSQNNGDGVYRRIRTTGWVRGYIVMTYARPTSTLVPYPGHQHWIDGKDDSHVTQIQKRLTQLGYRLVPDGHFGPKTDAAVRWFQKRQHIKVDGWVGRTTWSRLGIRTTR